MGRPIEARTESLLHIIGGNEKQWFLDPHKPLEEQESQAQITLNAIWNIGELFRGNTDVRLKASAESLIKLRLVSEGTASRMQKKKEVIKRRGQAVDIFDVTNSQSSLPDPKNNIVLLRHFPDTDGNQLVVVQQYHDLTEGRIQRHGQNSEKDDIIAKIAVVTKRPDGSYSFEVGKGSLMKQRRDDEGTWGLIAPRLPNESQAIDTSPARDLLAELLPQIGAQPFQFEPEEVKPIAIDRTLALMALGLHSPEVSERKLLYMMKKHDVAANA